LGYGPQNGVRNGLFTLKLDLWTAFGYTGFSVYGLFGRGAFGYTGFWVYGLFGTQAVTHHLMFSNAQNTQTEYHLNFQVCGLVYSYVLRRHCGNENVFSNVENVQMTLCHLPR
jgi:hypothetical protein